MVIITKFRQVSLATLSVSYLILRLEISSLPPSLTFLGWDSSDDDDDDDDGNEMDNHEDQPILLCSGKSLVIFVPVILTSNQVEQEDKDFFNLAFLPAIRSSIHSIISHPVIISIGLVDTAIRSSFTTVIIRTVSAEHYLGLRDRLQLWRDTLATVAKLGFAFLWQVGVTISIILRIFMSITLTSSSSASTCSSASSQCRRQWSTLEEQISLLKQIKQEPPCFHISMSEHFEN